FSLPGPCETLKKGMLESVVLSAAINRDAKIGEKKFYEADTIVYATGHSPLREEAEALRTSASQFYAIGDCVEPRNIYAANSRAFITAKDIGRI
ncbi:MAG: hypothetical protein FWB75_03880, partial [Oscillospiraceae bacterium]|nr:hypothetical protein [Oscillospiraceae bacterium]